MGNNNGVIIGTFVKKNKILAFLEFIKSKMQVNVNKVFIFNIDDNETEYLVTFSSRKNNPNFHKLHDATVLHTKNGCLFSINALNKYIETISPNNKNNQNFTIDWSKLKNILLITTNNKLKLSKLHKIEDKNKLF